MIVKRLEFLDMGVENFAFQDMDMEFWKWAWTVELLEMDVEFLETDVELLKMISGSFGFLYLK